MGLTRRIRGIGDRENGVLSIRSAYTVVEKLLVLEGNLNSLEKKVFGLIWRSPAPSKVVAFSWSLLLDRIPTRSNLVIRNVLDRNSNLNCVLCDLGEETSNHLFLHCNVVDKVWQKVLRWLEFHQIYFVHLVCWSDDAKQRKIRKGAWLIWHAALWVIWRARNEKVHHNRVRTVDEIVEEIKVRSWHIGVKVN